MRVLWFTNVPLPGAQNALGKQVPVVGGQINALAQALIKTGQVTILAVTFVAAGKNAHLFAENMHHLHIGIPAESWGHEAWFMPSEKTRRKCRRILASFQPDLVHIHGTEYTYGLLLADREITCPTVVSLQGLMGAYSRPMSHGLSPRELWKSHELMEFMRGTGIYHVQSDFARRAMLERRILSSPATFVGRTRYDRACLHAVNPYAPYYHCDDIMRASFYSMNRDPGAVAPRTIFSPVTWDPRKGFHCLLKAVGILRNEFPDIKVRVPVDKPKRSWSASGYSSYVSDLISKLNLTHNVAFLGNLPGEQMASELAQAELFAFATFADNSPSTIVEAMLMGTPIVVSLVGGIPSMVTDEETALCFPAGDEIVMAECIRRLFRDPQMAAQMAQRAQALARQRHDPAKITQTMLDIYHKALKS
jgi:glycosyltransferase involved in cell wall biosynthesis